MSINTRATEQFIGTHLPAAFAADSDPIEVYKDLDARIKEATINGAFDWKLLDHVVNQDTNIAAQIGSGQTSIVMPGRPTGLREQAPSQKVQLFGPEGTFVVVDASGQVLAYQNLPNTLVPAEYGPEDPWPWKKINEALYVSSQADAGSPDFNLPQATQGEGYAHLTELRRRLGEIGSRELPHIGHYAQIITETGGSTIGGYIGTTGRTLTQYAQKAIAEHYPAVAERMLTSDLHPDNLAGLIDTLSGQVVSRIVILGQRTVEQAHIVELPDPNSSEHVFVDWN